MDFSALFAFDAIAVAFLGCVAVREIAIVTLPDSVAGPGGSFIDTAPRKA
ncbi:MAG: hypothetical protein GKR99_14730 [Rhodobacteraceae bacterium]|nr:hypothetical protein [Paracoccaceae bacterium]